METTPFRECVWKYCEMSLLIFEEKKCKKKEMPGTIQTPAREETASATPCTGRCAPSKVSNRLLNLATVVPSLHNKNGLALSKLKFLKKNLKERKTKIANTRKTPLDEF